MGDKSFEKNDQFNQAKEALEQELKSLQNLKAQVLKSQKNKEEQEQELTKLDQEILEKEKEILKLKLEELKLLREQILDIDKKLNHETGNRKEEKESSNNLRSAFDNLERKINAFDNNGEHTFDILNKELDENLENFKNNLNELKKRTEKNLKDLETFIYYHKLEIMLPGHNPESLLNRINDAIGLEKALLTSKYDEKENKFAKRAAETALKIIGSKIL